MPRVVGMDAGTVSTDLCALDDGRLVLDSSMPTGEALESPARLLHLLEPLGRVDLIAAPSGYGLPLRDARELSDEEVRLAFLALPGEAGGIGGLRTLMRALAGLPCPVVVTPGVVHLPSVPAGRKINRIDIGTADKVCATALAVHEEGRRAGVSPAQVSLILLELGGAFTAAVAVADGRIVDGLGGTSGPMGFRAAGALDGEVALLAGSVSRALTFAGGVATITGMTGIDAAAVAASDSPSARLAWDAYLEGAVKAVLSLRASVPQASTVTLSGRVARVAGVAAALGERLTRVWPGCSVRALHGFALHASEAAQGAALVADGLVGGEHAPLVDALGLRAARGTVLDHLYVISAAEARARLGIV